jgi:2-oxoglutarate dehydrogenase E1 component
MLGDFTMTSNTMQSLWNSSILEGSNALYIEDLFEQYLVDPQSIPEAWRTFFKQLPQNAQNKDVSHAAVRAEFEKILKKPVLYAQGAPTSGQSVSLDHELKQIQVTSLINAYRLHGHLHAQIDPLSMRECQENKVAELTLEDHGLSVADLGTQFDVETFVGPQRMALGDLFKALNESYCGSIGTEYMHIPYPEERRWIQERIEGSRCNPNFSPELKKNILERLTSAEGLEKYLGSKYPGAKRFSLEGGDVLIPMLDECIQRAGAHGVKEVVIGMAHRGRLNVLVNTFGKKPSDLFAEFAGKLNPELQSGDVKYHQGFSSDVLTDGGSVHLALAFNPSHLEIVTPVVLGSVRARLTRWNDTSNNGSKVLPIAIHGDAAFAGQGVVMETLNMSQTRGYRIGGTLHLVINNQVGFTTSDTRDSRSTLYCSDVAKVIQAPIFHVNADDPEAVVFAMQVALDYRTEFKKDVVIDLVCYRRHGHNEADEPSATQPVMYQKIAKHPTVRQLYAEQLARESVIEAAFPQELVSNNRDLLDKGETVARKMVYDAKLDYVIDWSLYKSDDWRLPATTSLSKDMVEKLKSHITQVPDNFTLHPRVAKIMQDREKMLNGELALDWGCAELLAYGSLLLQGHGVRISGQDCRRGTFFHRHAGVFDQKTNDAYLGLQHISEDQPTFEVIDSLLSEEAVMAFEYGFACSAPKIMTIWEGQFGDFANGAQVVIDQFISSGKQKWGRLCGLSLFLPHGYEGQGPEHSSARLERFLQLCAENNIQVCVPSTAAQAFHMIRRQMIRNVRTPLVVMTPKSLLRHKSASCDLSEFLTGEFQAVIPEVEKLNSKAVNRVVLCSGKVYYDLVEARAKNNQKNVAIIRIEQLYPFPEEELKTALKPYQHVSEIVWCQEEPQNQGAWFPSSHHMWACLNKTQQLSFAGRLPAAAPACGYYEMHNQQQQMLIKQALGQ